MEPRPINHIAIIGTDYERSMEFYVLKLGMVVKKETVRVAKNDVKVDLAFGDMTFELFIKPEVPARPSYPEAAGLRHISFATDDIEADIRELKAKNIRVESVRRDELNQRKMTFFFDPDGLPIELHE